MYPVNLNVNGKPVIVVGGGGVALRKVQGLCDEGAKVTVVASEPIDSIKEMAQQGHIVLHQRSYEPGEVTGYTLAFAATDDRGTNRRVFLDGEEVPEPMFRAGPEGASRSVRVVLGRMG